MDFRWKIRLSPGAARELSGLPTKGMKAEVAQALRELQQDAFGADSAPLENHREQRKVYLSRGYRMIYTVSEPHRQIFIDRIRPHDAAYSGFGE
jgi:mRNA-degrading endonuclease RelE of RelBE toxin-antitoxin system